MAHLNDFVMCGINFYSQSGQSVWCMFLTLSNTIKQKFILYLKG